MEYPEDYDPETDRRSPEEYMQEAARAFYESSVNEHRAHEREYNRLAFFLVVGFLSEPHKNATITRLRGHYFRENVNTYYEQAWGTPSPYRVRTDEEMAALLGVASRHFTFSKDLISSDARTIAFEILNHGPGVTFVPDLSRAA